MCKPYKNKKKLIILFLGLFGTFFTYDNELHVSIGIDKKFFTNREQSRKIINDIFENITLFDEETNTNKKINGNK